MRGAFDEREMEPARPRRDTELTLSSMTLLGIFFGLVLLCGLCFGLGTRWAAAALKALLLPSSRKQARNHIAGGWLPPQAAGKRGAAGLNRCSQLLGRYGCWAN